MFSLFNLCSLHDDIKKIIFSYTYIYFYFSNLSNNFYIFTYCIFKIGIFMSLNPDYSGTASAVY